MSTSFNRGGRCSPGMASKSSKFTIEMNRIIIFSPVNSGRHRNERNHLTAPESLPSALPAPCHQRHLVAARFCPQLHRLCYRCCSECSELRRGRCRSSRRSTPGTLGRWIVFSALAVIFGGRAWRWSVVFLSRVACCTHIVSTLDTQYSDVSSGAGRFPLTRSICVRFVQKYPCTLALHSITAVLTAAGPHLQH